MTARRVLAAIAALLLAATLTPPSASARPSDPPAAARLLISYDGATWHDELPALFEPTALVPGDRLSRTLFVRNASADAAVLTVASGGTTMDAATDHGFLDDLQLSIGTSETAGIAVPFSALPSTVLYGAALAPAQIVALEVAMELPRDAASGSDAVAQDAPFSLRFMLDEDQATIPGDQSGTVLLPATGGNVVGLWWTAVAIAAGAAITALDRRRAAARNESTRG